MNPSDERDPLTEAYRRASVDDAGRPADATRNAILAEAAAAARRRTPAANESRYVLRGVAGVAVLGVAVLLWQQVDHRLPGDVPVAMTEPAAVQSAADKATAPVPGAPATQAVEQKPAPMAPPPTVPSMAQSAQADASRTEARVAQAENAPVMRGAAVEEMESLAADAAQGAANSARMAESAARSAAPPPAAFAPPAAPAAKISAAQDAQVDADALLRLNFPQQYQSDQPHSVWLVQNAAGAVLRSGEVRAGQTYAGIRADVERELGGTLLRPWRIRTLQNARGQSIELAVAQTP